MFKTETPGNGAPDVDKEFKSDWSSATTTEERVKKLNSFVNPVLAVSKGDLF